VSEAPAGLAARRRAEQDKNAATEINESNNTRSCGIIVQSSREDRQPVVLQSHRRALLRNGHDGGRPDA
jgi:hypothetical protein